MSPHNLFSLLVERMLLNASELSMRTYNVLFEVRNFVMLEIIMHL